MKYLVHQPKHVPNSLGDTDSNRTNQTTVFYYPKVAE